MKKKVYTPSKILALTLFLTMQPVNLFSQALASNLGSFEKAPSLKDSFWVDCNNFSSLPPVFRNGYVMVYRREEPGAIVLLDVKGKIIWRYQLQNAGFKVVRYTKNHTLFCITGTKENAIGYGNTILELSLKGDTLLYLKQGKGGFQQPIHHDLLLNSKNQIVALSTEAKVYDLRTRGGVQKDTVFGDAILVLDRQGRQIWKWTVFDKINPLLDPNILKTKKDWMHANSIAIDKDGHYLISFYNNGQIWKVHSTTGNIIWKFGKNGDFDLPAYVVFDQAHAVHINNKGWIMLFDNGANKKLSRTLAFSLDKTTKKAQPAINVWLPPPLYTDRMGSSYLVGDTTLLVCASRHRTVVLTNLQGSFLWQLSNNRIMSYRAEFIPKEMIAPFIKGLPVRIN